MEKAERKGRDARKLRIKLKRERAKIRKARREKK